MEANSSSDQSRTIAEEVFESTFKTLKLSDKATESARKAFELEDRYTSIENELREANKRLDTVEAILRQDAVPQAAQPTSLQHGPKPQQVHANAEPVQSELETIKNLNLTLRQLESMIEELSRTQATMSDLRALVGQCNTELRDYDDFLSERIEAIQEFVVMSSVCAPIRRLIKALV